MSTDERLPAWAIAGREGWTWTGQGRPPFAVPPAAGQESVWDYPRPPRLEADSREVIVRHGDLVVARTSTPVRLLETSHPPTFYVPRGEVAMQYLTRAAGESLCEWKGACTYFDVVVGDLRIPRGAWSYERPFRDTQIIAGHVAFYASPLACSVGGERARPQAGGFYGGWITPDLVGPFKGDPGTRGW